jgi:hypothetical protein
MHNSDLFAEISTQSNKLWRSGRYAEAFTLVDEGISKAEQNKEAHAVPWLRLHACVMARTINDFALVRRHCEQLLAAEPDNTQAIYTLADALSQQGEVELASRQAARGYALLCHSRDEVDQSLLELFLKRWPGIKEG